MRIKIITLVIALTTSLTFADFSGSDYSEAMRMAVKFFGGQRCGNTHNWMLYGNDTYNVKVCHTKDAYNGHDLSGGWHDCGDHIKVATTMGYAAICLLSAYDIWPAAFEDDHDPNYNPGPNGIPDVLDEAKIATDYFMKSLIDGKTFVYYVGNSHDHDRWVTSAFQSSLGPDLGGDPRPVSVTTSDGGAQAADYASALALMAMHYPDQTYAQKCKDAAVQMYTYAKAHPTNISIPDFYTSPNTDIYDELALAAILMYNLTKDESYKTDAISRFSGKWESNAPLAWDTKTDIAYYYIIKAVPNANNGDANGGLIKKFLQKNVQAGISAASSSAIPWSFLKSTWGTNKLACGSAFAAVLYAKLIDDGVITPVDNLTAATAYSYNKKIIDYMLGTNEFNHPFIHGYKGDMNFKIHHRNAMGRNDNPNTDTKNSASFMFKSGGLIGGPTTAGVFHNIIEGGDFFKETEGGCDYNGPLIAAMANIVSKMDPKLSIKNDYLKKAQLKNSLSASNNCRIVNVQGKSINQSILTTKSLTQSGIYFIQNGNQNSHAIEVMYLK